jgi:quercetin dioxygenase-like cupin family protein
MTPTTSHRLIDAETLRISPNTLRFDGANHGAGICVFVLDYPPGKGPDLHRHPYEEVSVVHEGAATFTAGDAEAGAGQVLIVAPQTPHKFVAEGPGRLRMVAIQCSPRMTPSGSSEPWLARGGLPAGAVGGCLAVPPVAARRNLRDRVGCLCSEEQDVDPLQERGLDVRSRRRARSWPAGAGRLATRCVLVAALAPDPP